jgi:cysteine-rich repeat protein
VTRPFSTRRSGDWISAARLAGALAIALVPVSAIAHGSRQPLAAWGGFESATARCQRAIGDAAATCAGGAWAERDACRRAILAGQACDEAAITARIADLRRNALDYVDRFCSERQLTDLSYLGSFDVQSDVVDFCRAWPNAAESATYDLPATSSSSCIESAAAQTTRLMESVFRLRRQAMEAIAVRSLDLDTKMRILADAERRLGHAVTAIGARLAELCPADSFRAVYGVDVATLLGELEQRADCIGAQFYIQDAFLCPAAVCGNGVQEPGEACDDGNLVDGDRCSADCQMLTAP